MNIEELGAPSNHGASNRADHLRQLKDGQTDPADASAAAEKRLAAALAKLGLKERRMSPRQRCSGSVEFRAEGSDMRLWGNLTDISQHGCYVEMTSTFPLNTRVHLGLKSGGIKAQVTGVVRATYPALGMGIRFVELESGQQRQLKQILDSLLGRNAHPASPALNDEMKGALASVDARAFLDEIAAFFQKNESLAREEFYQIAKRVRRS